MPWVRALGCPADRRTRSDRSPPGIGRFEAGKLAEVRQAKQAIACNGLRRSRNQHLPISTGEYHAKRPLNCRDLNLRWQWHLGCADPPSGGRHLSPTMPHRVHWNIRPPGCVPNVWPIFRQTWSQANSAALSGRSVRHALHFAIVGVDEMTHRCPAGRGHE